GLEKLSAGKIDLVILDLNMPVLDGIEMLSLIRADPAHSDLEVIVASAVGSEAKVREVISLGVSDYLLKPLQHDRVIARLEAAFERIMERRQQKANQGDLSRTRILVADTDPNFLEFASAALAAQFTTQAVKTTGEVLVKMLRFKPDVVLLSPKMAGERLSFLLEKIDTLAKKRRVAIYALVDSQSEKIQEARIAGTVARTFVPETFASSVVGLLGGGPAPGHGILSWISSIEPEIYTALRQALGMMTGSEPVSIEAAPADRGFDLFGIISLEAASRDFELTVEVRCQKTFARSLVRLMLGCGEEDIDDETQASGLQEILNVVAGRIKNSCQERKIEVMLGLPKISGEMPQQPRGILHQKELHFTWEQAHTFQLTFLGCTLRHASGGVPESLAGPPAQASPEAEAPAADGHAPSVAPPAEILPEAPAEPSVPGEPDGGSSELLQQAEKASDPV
ncbi:MAG: response regulator, partial [Acidobacteria bacterium]|nr:response regulator [Acidobacteriota bacterium]